MAVTAIDPQSSDVMLVAERNRLRPRHFCISHIGRALELNARPKDKGNEKDRPKDRGARNCISTAMKNLHRSELSVLRENDVPRFLVGMSFYGLRSHR